MTDTTNALSLTVRRSIKAAPRQVFDAWLDPAMLARFMLASPRQTVHSVKTDPRPGGRFDLVMQMDDKDLPHGGVYQEITPHSRLVFSWESPWSVKGSTVTLTFTPQGAGTLVELTHVQFASEQSRDNHENGWTAILAKLEETMA